MQRSFLSIKGQVLKFAKLVSHLNPKFDVFSLFYSLRAMVKEHLVSFYEVSTSFVKTGSIPS